MKNQKYDSKKHCKFCKDGRVVLTSKDFAFCSLCGHEFRLKQ